VDSTYQSTDEAAAASGPPTRPASETVEFEWPARVSLALGHKFGRRTWLRVDADVAFASDFGDANGIGARVQMRPVPRMRLEAGGDWRSGIEASMGLGVSEGRLTWRLHGRSARNGRDVSLATGLPLR
jgi:hypothetical protein